MLISWKIRLRLENLKKNNILSNFFFFFFFNKTKIDTKFSSHLYFFHNANNLISISSIFPFRSRFLPRKILFHLSSIFRLNASPAPLNPLLSYVSIFLPLSNLSSRVSSVIFSSGLM